MIFLPNNKNIVSDAEVKASFISKIQPFFRFDISSRVDIKTDVNQFRVMEDKSVWEQARGLRPHYHEVYWDGVWMCDFVDSDDVSNTLKRFWTGFVNAYEAEQINLNDKADIKQHEEKLLLDELAKKAEKEAITNLKKAEENIERLPDSTEEERLSKEVLKEIVKEKKEQKQTRNKLKSLKEVENA